VASAELTAVVFGFAYILLAILERRACWIAGGVSAAIFVVVLWHAGLPMQSALQLIFVAMSAWGWFAWRASASEPLPRDWPLWRHLVGVAGVGLATAISAPLAARYPQAAAPIADSLTTWASVFATWLLARRIIGNWIWWIVIDAGLTLLFAAQGLAKAAVLYFAFTLLAVAGWYSWRKRQAAG